MKNIFDVKKDPHGDKEIIRRTPKPLEEYTPVDPIVERKLMKRLYL
jgi:hypothetical protein